MAHLWIKAASSKAQSDAGDARNWRHIDIDGFVTLNASSIDRCDGSSHRPPNGSVLLYPYQKDGPDTTWVLLTPPDCAVQVNEWPLTTGIRALRDRDAIRLPDGETVYFSTEALPRIEAFSIDAEMHCVRCKRPIVRGSPAVRCTCGVWHHEDPANDRACFTYSAKCAVCDQSTNLESLEFSWSPEEL